MPQHFEIVGAKSMPAGGNFEALAATLDLECVLYQPDSLP